MGEGEVGGVVCVIVGFIFKMLITPKSVSSLTSRLRYGSFVGQKKWRKTTSEKHLRDWELDRVSVLKLMLVFQ